MVEVVGDAKKFNQAADSAVGKANNMGSVIKGVGMGIGLGAFNLAAQGVGMFVGALDEAQTAYKADEASQALMKQALENLVPGWSGSTEAIEEYAAAQLKLGFQDDDIRASISQLIGITHDETEAMRLNTIAQDLARSKGIDLATATDIVTKAAQGNGRALKALGIDIGGATDAAGMLDAIQKNVTGSAETWAATSEGKTAVEQAKQAEAWEKIGKIVDKIAMIVLPVLTEALTVVANVLGFVFEAISPVIDALVRDLGPAFQKIGQIAGVVFPAIGRVIGGIATTVTQVFSTVASVIRGALNAVIGIVNGVIGGINRIQVHIHVGPVNLDWWGLRLGYIPYLHSGGIVPGAPGTDVLTMLQAGERVTPAGAAGASIVINVYGDTYGDGIEKLADQLAMRLRLQGV